MIKRLIAVIALCLPAFSTTTVTGNIKTLGTTNQTGGFVRFWLRGCNGNQPRINGTGIIAPTLGGVFYFDFVADANGAVGSGSISPASTTLYSTRDATGNGNGEIECGGSFTAAWYGMQVFQGGKGGPEVAVHAKISATIDVSNVTPITTTPVVVAPTGDTTYIRLDGGNSPVTGSLTFSSASGGFTSKYGLGNERYVSSLNCSAWWSQTDMGACINAAYADLPSNGGTILIVSQSSIINYSTPIVFGTAGKPATLGCTSAGGFNVGPIGFGGACVLNYTPTTATSAITLSDSQTGGSGGMTGAGLRDVTLFNNNCTTTGGCGSSATGVAIGANGAGHADISNTNIAGFGTAVSSANSTGWGLVFRNDEFLNNTTGWSFTTGLENIDVFGARFIGNTTAMTLAPGEYFLYGVSCDSSVTVCVNSTGALGTGYIQAVGFHCENTNLGTTHCFTGNGNNITLIGGMLENDITTSSGDYFITVAAGELSIYGTKLLSAGQTMTSPIVCNSGCRANVTAVNYTPANITAVDAAHGMVSGTSNAIIDMSYNINSSNAASIVHFDTGAFTFPNGFGMTIADNTASHVRTLEFGPNVCTNDFWCIFDKTGSKNLLTCAWLSTFGCLFPGEIKPVTAANAGVGTNALPWNGLFLGTAATNNFNFSPNSTSAARTVTIPDPGTNVNLAFDLTATSSAFATATTAGTCVNNTTAVAGAATTMTVLVSPVSTPGVGAQWSAYVSSAGNVTINECAVATSAGGTIAFNIRVFP